jgi:hypothetical protein
MLLSVKVRLFEAVPGLRRLHLVKRVGSRRGAAKKLGEAINVESEGVC